MTRVLVQTGFVRSLFIVFLLFSVCLSVAYHSLLGQINNQGHARNRMIVIGLIKSTQVIRMTWHAQLY